MGERGGEEPRGAREAPQRRPRGAREEPERRRCGCAATGIPRGGCVCGAGEVRRSRCVAGAVWAVVGVVRVSESNARVCLRMCERVCVRVLRVTCTCRSPAAGRRSSGGGAVSCRVVPRVL